MPQITQDGWEDDEEPKDQMREGERIVKDLKDLNISIVDISTRIRGVHNVVFGTPALGKLDSGTGKKIPAPKIENTNDGFISGINKQLTIMQDRVQVIESMLSKLEDL